MPWQPESFEIAFLTGPVNVAGYTYRDLGLFMAVEASKKGKRPPLWNLSHLGTGHRLAFINGHVRTAFPIATEIAEAGNWEFLSLEGWKDCFPDAPERLREICERHSQHIHSHAMDGVDRPHDDRSRAVAQQIASNRP